MNEEQISAPSNLERILKLLTLNEIPALYFLLEVVASFVALWLFITVVMSMYRVRALTGNYSMMSMHMADVSPPQLLAKIFASVFLGSFGVGQALISNTVFMGSFEPYSIEVLRSISCSMNDSNGCLHYELGMFSEQSWSRAAVNQTFFEFFTAMVTIFGSVCYLLGWLAFSQLGAGGQGKPRGFVSVMFQIVIGAALMRPAETWQMITGGF